MFGSFLDKLDSWIGRSFIVGSYLPFLVFTAANVLTAQIFYPDKVKTIFEWARITNLGLLDATFSFLAVSAILAYVTSPLVGIMSNALRGQYFSGWVRRRLLDEQQARRVELENNVESTGLDSINNDRETTLKERLRAATQTGERLGTATAIDSIDAADSSLEKLRVKRGHRDSVSPQDVDEAVAAVEAALQVNCWNATKLVRADLEGPGAAAEINNSKRLVKLYKEMIDLIAYARGYADVEYTLARSRKQIEFSQSDIHPTLFGNRYAALTYYFENRFNIDLDFILPVLRAVVQNDKEAAEALTKAQQQMEFAIRTYVFIILFTIIWLILVLFHRGSYLAVPIIGTIGLIAAVSALAIIHASFTSFGDAVRAISILKRFDILDALHMPLPANWEEEKSTWRIVNGQLQWGELESGVPLIAKDLVYRHPKPRNESGTKTQTILHGRIRPRRRSADFVFGLVLAARSSHTAEP